MPRHRRRERTARRASLRAIIMAEASLVYIGIIACGSALVAFL